MKKIMLYILPLMFALLSCSGGGGGSDSGGDGVTNMQAGVEEKGAIGTVGEVDWYKFRANEVRSIVQVRLAGQFYRSKSDEDFEFSMAVYEEDSAGRKVRLMADHDELDNYNPANMSVSVFVDQPKDLFISVRDHMDDKSSIETYAIEVNYEDNDDEDSTFEDATALIIDTGGSCPRDTISSITDVDCYTFTVTETGSYEIVADFIPFGDGSSVKLEMELYRVLTSGQNELVEDLENNNSDTYRIVRPLEAGTYNLMIADQGRNNSDVSSSYTVCVNSVNSSEVLVNDNYVTATVILPDADVNGSLDYTGDEDWYRIDAGTNNVLDLVFDGSGNSNPMTYLAEIYHIDSSGVDPVYTKILTHEIHSGAGGHYDCQVLLSHPGDHFIVVKASGNSSTQYRGLAEIPVLNISPYTFTVSLDGINDPDETGDGNNTISTATDVNAAGENLTGKMIGFRGDNDYYKIEVTGPKILEVFFEADEVSQVEYAVSIINGDETTVKADTKGLGTVPTHLKTSIFVDDVNPKTIYIKVCDYQGDDGDNVQYNLNIGVKDIPAVIDDFGKSPVYANEATIGSLDDKNVTVNYFTILQKSFKANTTLLSFDTDDLDPVAGQEDTYTVELPWIAGYVDFDGDHDFYQLKLDALAYEGIDAHDQYYYDISVQLVTQNGTDVEYIWKLYTHGTDESSSFIDRPVLNGYEIFDRYIACAGDDTPLNQLALDITTPTGETKFWVGNELTSGNVTTRDTYFSVSDFDFLVNPQDGNDPHDPLDTPDNDWGYEYNGNNAPYYFKITLTYHPGIPRPTDL